MLFGSARHLEAQAEAATLKRQQQEAIFQFLENHAADPPAFFSAADIARGYLPHHQPRDAYERDPERRPPAAFRYPKMGTQFPMTTDEYDQQGSS